MSRRLRVIIREELQRALNEQQNTPEAEARLKSPHINYFGPERGPFRCGNCRFLNIRRSFCEHKEVKAFVNKDGCCNEFKTRDKDE